MPKTICPQCGGTGQKIDHEKLKMARTKSGMTLKQVATKMGISIMYLCDMEHGRRNWSPDLLRRFQQAIE